MKFLSGGTKMCRNGRRMPTSILLSGRAGAVAGPFSSRAIAWLAGLRGHTDGGNPPPNASPQRKIRAARDQRRENGWSVSLTNDVPARGLVVDTAQPRGSGTATHAAGKRVGHGDPRCGQAGEVLRLTKRAALIVRQRAKRRQGGRLHENQLRSQQM